MDASELRKLSAVFADGGWRYAVIGGYGLLARGIARATFDLDLVTERSAQKDLVRYLTEEGYETLHCSPNYSNHLHAESDIGRLDVVYVNEPTAEALFESADTLEILNGWEAPVPRPEHLAAMKARAIKNDPGRKLADLADVREIGRLPGVDRAEIRGYFDTLDLSDLFDEIDFDDA